MITVFIFLDFLPVFISGMHGVPRMRDDAAG
jgi:hypothetical protein